MTSLAAGDRATGTSLAGTSEHLPPISVVGRLDRLRQILATEGAGSTSGASSDGSPSGGPLDVLVVTESANIRWLTGFSGSAGTLLVTPERALLVTDGRYRTQSAEQVDASGAEGVDIIIGGGGAQRDALVAAASGASRVGLEADRVSWAAATSWEASFSGSALVPASGLVEQLRHIKDEAEIARMELAAAAADAALAQTLPLLAAAGRRTGEVLTEAAFGAALDHAMRMQGAEDRAFETIVASGENSAKPHARPGSRIIGPGDPVVVDFGAMVDGYRSDMTRTFCVGGEPTGTLADVFAVVAQSQRAGVATVTPGREAGDVDAACREVIGAAGWAEHFEHGTGHGVGLDIHEGPSVGAGSTAILHAGTVVTVEPGVYLPEIGGVRIEDTLVVTSEGSRPLTLFPKDVAV